MYIYICIYIYTVSTIKYIHMNVYAYICKQDNHANNTYLAKHANNTYVYIYLITHT